MFNPLRQHHQSRCCGSVQAGDLLTLARLLQPAFLAMNLASACNASSGWALSQPRGQRGGAWDYGFHTRAEVMAGLRAGDQQAVLHEAAEAARNEALRQTRQYVLQGDPALERARLRAWCDGAVTDHIATFIRDHDARHSVFYEQLTQAKRTDGT